MPEIELLVHNYEHLDKLPGAKDALHSLRKVASLVKPIMRTRGWHVGVLTEFYPEQTNLLGLNVNRGQKICLRLRYPGKGNEKRFLPIEEIVDTMLHELSHIVHGPHNEQFHALWNALRKEHEELTSKGYTGEGFLSEGRRLGGNLIPIQEMRRQARVAAERRRTANGSGQKLGGRAVLRGADIRQVIADAAAGRRDRTKEITQKCGSGAQGANIMADQASKNGFRTEAEEDDSNDQAIAQALWELVQEEESRKNGEADDGWKTEGLTWSAGIGLQPAGASHMSKKVQVIPPSVIERKASSSASTSGPQLPIHSKPAGTLYSQFPRHFETSTETVLKKRSFSDVNNEPPISNPAPQPSPTTWCCPACTLVNPIGHLCCDACASEQPQDAITQPNPVSSATTFNKAPASRPVSRLVSKSGEKSNGKLKQKSSSLLHPDEAAQRAATEKRLGWNCSYCGTFMESQWWTCSHCGMMKATS